MTRSQASPSPGIARGHKQIFGRNYVADLPYPQSFVPAGFIVSTANDLTRYLAAQLPGSTQARKLGLSDAGIALWHKGVAAMDSENKAHYAMGWVTDTFNGVPVVWHNGDTGVFSSEFTLEPKGQWAVVALANGSGWLPQEYLQEISSGIVNLQRAARRATIPASISSCSSSIAPCWPCRCCSSWRLWLMRTRKAGWFGRIWPVGLHALAAGGMLVELPRMVFGIPFTEMLTSFPDMAAAAILSGMLAIVALVQTLRAGVSETPRSHT